MRPSAIAERQLLKEFAATTTQRLAGQTEPRDLKAQKPRADRFTAPMHETANLCTNQVYNQAQGLAASALVPTRGASPQEPHAHKLFRDSARAARRAQTS